MGVWVRGCLYMCVRVACILRLVSPEYTPVYPLCSLVLSGNLLYYSWSSVLFFLKKRLFHSMTQACHHLIPFIFPSMLLANAGQPYQQHWGQIPSAHAHVWLHANTQTRSVLTIKQIPVQTLKRHL